MNDVLTRTAAVSANRHRAEIAPQPEARTELDRIGWQTAAQPERTGSAAVSATRVSRRPALSNPADGVFTPARPVAGRYIGQTDERYPVEASFRFVGSGIRDLVVDGQMIARWIPIADREGNAPGAARVSWVNAHHVRGTFRRRTRSKTQLVRFAAEHRFAGLAG